MGIASKRALLGAAASAFTFATPHLRQVADNKDEKAKASAAKQVQNLTVTAQRRKENIQKVPLAVTALGGDSLETRSITGFEDLGTRVPSLRFGAGVTGGE